MEVAAEYVGFTIKYPQDAKDGGGNEICVSFESVLCRCKVVGAYPERGVRTEHQSKPVP